MRARSIRCRLRSNAQLERRAQHALDQLGSPFEHFHRKARRQVAGVDVQCQDVANQSAGFTDGSQCAVRSRPDGDGAWKPHDAMR
jgi:hypothetical protein